MEVTPPLGEAAEDQPVAEPEEPVKPDAELGEIQVVEPEEPVKRDEPVVEPEEDQPVAELEELVKPDAEPGEDQVVEPEEPVKPDEPAVEPEKDQVVEPEDQVKPDEPAVEPEPEAPLGLPEEQPTAAEGSGTEGEAEGSQADAEQEEQPEGEAAPPQPSLSEDLGIGSEEDELAGDSVGYTMSDAERLLGISQPGAAQPQLGELEPDGSSQEPLLGEQEAPPEQPPSAGQDAEPLLGLGEDTQPLLGFGQDAGPQEPLLGFGQDAGPQEPLLGFGQDAGPQEPLLGLGQDTGPQEPLLGFGEDAAPQDPLVATGLEPETSPQEPLLAVGLEEGGGPQEPLLDVGWSGPQEPLLDQVGQPQEALLDVGIGLEAQEPVEEKDGEEGEAPDAELDGQDEAWVLVDSTEIPQTATPPPSLDEMFSFEPSLPAAPLPAALEEEEEEESRDESPPLPSSSPPPIPSSPPPPIPSSPPPPFPSSPPPPFPSSPPPTSEDIDIGVDVGGFEPVEPLPPSDAPVEEEPKDVDEGIAEEEGFQGDEESGASGLFGAEATTDVLNMLQEDEADMQRAVDDAARRVEQLEAHSAQQDATGEPSEPAMEFPQEESVPTEMETAAEEREPSAEDFDVSAAEQETGEQVEASGSELVAADLPHEPQWGGFDTLVDTQAEDQPPVPGNWGGFDSLVYEQGLESLGSAPQDPPGVPVQEEGEKDEAGSPDVDPQGGEPATADDLLTLDS